MCKCDKKVLKLFLYVGVFCQLIDWEQIDAAGVIPATKQCGTNLCKWDEYCSSFSNQCDRCDDVCGETHNFDANICHSLCQGKQFCFYFMPLVVAYLFLLNYFK